MPNQTVKNGPKAKKIKLPQMNFFSQKTTNKIFMYLLAPFILKNFEKILRANPELWRCAFFRPKMAHLSWTKKFLYKRWLLLSTTYWPFSLCKILKKFLQQIQRYEDASFLGRKWIICPKQCFFRKKLLKSFSSTYWLLSFCKINKKFLVPIQSYEDAPFSGPNYPNLSWTKFFGTNRYYYFHLTVGPFHWAKF